MYFYIANANSLKSL